MTPGCWQTCWSGWWIDEWAAALVPDRLGGQLDRKDKFILFLCKDVSFTETEKAKKINK